MEVKRKYHKQLVTVINLNRTNKKMLARETKGEQKWGKQKEKKKIIFLFVPLLIAIDDFEMMDFFSLISFFLSPCFACNNNFDCRVALICGGYNVIYFSFHAIVNCLFHHYFVIGYLSVDTTKKKVHVQFLIGFSKIQPKNVSHFICCFTECFKMGSDDQTDT